MLSRVEHEKKFFYNSWPGVIKTFVCISPYLELSFLFYAKCNQEQILNNQADDQI